MSENCVIYVRVSTEEQKQHGLSPEVQLKQAKEEVVKRNLILAERPYADEGKSGTTMNRDGLQTLLTRCKKGDIRYVIVQDTSRLSRDTTDYLLLRKMFEDYNVQVISINQPMTNNPDDAYARFVDEVIAAANALHPRVTSMKVKLNMREKFEFGWWPSWAAYGYKNIDNPNPTCKLDQKIIVPDPMIGSLIKESFELFSTGEFSIWRLVQDMYKKGLTSRTGKMMSISSMQQILVNTFYYGLMRLNGKEKIGKHTSLISKQLFDQCQFVLRKHRQFMVRQRKHNFFLRGFLFCPLHNRWLTAEWHSINSKKRSRIAYYHCSQKGGCRGSYIDSDIIERFIASEFKKLQFTQEFIDLVKKNIGESFKDSRKAIQSEKQALINKKKVLETQRGTLEDMLLDKTIDRETFKRKHAELQGKIKALEDQITEVEAKHQLDVNLIDEVLAFTRNIHQTYLNAPEFLKRHYIRFFFERFEIKDKEVVKVVDNPIFSTLKKEQQVIIVSELGSSTKHRPQGRFFVDSRNRFELRARLGRVCSLFFDSCQKEYIIQVITLSSLKGQGARFLLDAKISSFELISPF